MTFRLVLVVVAVTAFGLLGIRDIVTGQVAVGCAGLMLAGANAILLTR